MPFIAFFAVIPFDSEVILLYRNGRIASAFMFALRFVVLSYAIYLFLKKKPFSDKEIKILIRYSVYFFFIACLNCLSMVFAEGDISFGLVKTIATRTMSMVCIWGFLVCCLYWSRDLRVFVGMSFVSAFMMILSVFVFLLFPEHGTSRESASVFTFKGVATNRNGYIVYALCFICGFAVYLYEKLKNKKGNIFKKFISEPVAVCCFIGIYLLSFVTVMLTKSMSGMLLFPLFSILFIVFLLTGKKFPVWVVPVLYGLVWIVIGIIGIEKFIPNEIFNRIFHRSITLTNRTVLWDYAKELFRYSPLTGFGFDNTHLADMHIVADGNNTFINTPHNAVLYLLLTQGILGLIAWLYMVIVPLSKAAAKNKKIITFVLIYISTIIMRGLVEDVFQYSNMMLWCMIVALEVVTERDGELCEISDSFI